MAPRKTNQTKTLKRRALRIEQNKNHPLYVFSLTGDELLEIADISRISRDKAGNLIGYQRADVKRHVNDIVEYLNQDEIIFPNSIILALSSRVKFKQSRGPSVGDGLATAGILEIPYSNESSKKPAWIVDGQQRAIALSKCDRKDFPIPVNAFVADEVGLQRDQFLRVNSSKPLPHGLITELLPEVTTELPARLSIKRMPSAICDWLNRDKSSPFFGLIKRASTPGADKSKCPVTDTQLIKAIEESLSSHNGFLHTFRDISAGETDFDGICNVLVTYWTAVSKVFPDAWGKRPTKSRLMHGAGIRSMGRLMDRIMPVINFNKSNPVAQTEREIKLIKPICRWIKGHWDISDGPLQQARWDAVQNYSTHIKYLSNYLMRAYLKASSR